MPESCFKSRAVNTAASADRLPYPMKQYATDGENIPYRKNWAATWCTLPIHFDNVLEDILNFELRPDDVFVATYMKSGTTWMQECAWLLLNNLDFATSREAVFMKKSPFIDFRGILPTTPNPIELCKELPSPRLIKTHLPANLIPQQIWKRKQKIIYVARNVKDVIVSSYHFTKNLGMWRGETIEDFVDDFLNDEIHYTNFCCHVVDYWKMRQEPFIFFVTYEEMKRNLAGVLQKLCDFLERPQLTVDQLEEMLKHLSFSDMKENAQTNLTEILKSSMPGVKEEFQFMRRGVVGSYKDELTQELQAKIDKWTKESLAHLGLTEKDIFGQL